MEAKRSYHKICTESTALNMVLQNLEEIVCHVFVTGKFIKWILLSPPHRRLLI